MGRRGGKPSPTPINITKKHTTIVTVLISDHISEFTIFELRSDVDDTGKVKVRYPWSVHKDL